MNWEKPEQIKKQGKFRMKAPVRNAVLLLTLFFLGTSLSAQYSKRTLKDRFIFDIHGRTLIPQAEPAGIGAGFSFGYEFRDFNLLLRTTGLMAEPSTNMQLRANPAFRVEIPFRLVRSTFTILPYIDLGSMTSQIRLPLNQGKSGYITSFYAEGGAGIEYIITHELSAVFRAGAAHAIVQNDSGSNNFSGPTLELALRYVVNRDRMLDY